MANNSYIECPICMDEINMNTNCVTTECGHTFHCSCLLKNAAHNGFGCPYCRSSLAEEVIDEDDEEELNIYDEQKKLLSKENRTLYNNSPTDVSIIRRKSPIIMDEVKL